jgi:DNA anti-recombination protein RmuC
MTNVLIEALASMSADEVTSLFISVILGAAVLCLISYFAGWLKRLTTYAPSLLTSLGILGTFTGIIIGLMDFDATNAESIDASIGALLEGLKTAFITSLVGMAAAIVYKVITSILLPISAWFQNKADTSNKENTDATGNDLLRAIEQGNEQQATHQAAQQQELDKLNKALTGEGDSSLSTLIGKQRLESREFNEALCTRLDKLQSTNQTVAERLEQQDVQLTEGLSAFNSTAQLQLGALEGIGQGMSRQEVRFERFATDLEQQLKDFAEMLSKSATEQMIEALKNVIAEFNNTLTEQFGENFKALDASVKKLVDWQENYKEQLGEMRAQFDLSVKALADSEQSVSHISQSAATIPETMSGMQTLLETSRHQIDELERHLGAFVEMRDKAVEAVPQMQQQVEASVKDVTQAATLASEHYQTLLDDSDRYIKQHNESVADFLSRFTTTTDESTAKLREQMLESAGELKATLSEGAADIGKELQRQSGELENHFNTSSQGLEKGSQSIVDASEGFAKETQTMLEQLKQGGLETSKQIEAIQAQVSDRTEEMQKRLTQSFDDVISTQTEQMNKAYQQMAGLIENAAKKGSESVQEQAQQLDESMQEEINRVMQTMGMALAQIAGRFTEDYRSLTAQMQQVVSSARDEERMS